MPEPFPSSTDLPARRSRCAEQAQQARLKEIKALSITQRIHLALSLPSRLEWLSPPKGSKL
jgi:hypothetical protein